MLKLEDMLTSQFVADSQLLIVLEGIFENGIKSADSKHNTLIAFQTIIKALVHL